jgi:hypothetical protein
MRITNRRQVNVHIILSAFLLCATLPSIGYGYGQAYYQGAYYGQAYYQGYYQGTYYSQATYYSQGSYDLVFTKNVSEKGGFAVTGSISKGSGTFVIDHPLDPANKLLYHSFVESPDAKNMYDGIATLNGAGEATVRLPDYFDALNGEVRYQVKPIGESMPNLHIKEEEHDNTFVIGGGVPGGKVSWQVTGIRHDPFIEANPIIPEVEKGPDQLVDRGQYLFSGYEKKFPLSGFFEGAAAFFSGLFGSS